MRNSYTLTKKSQITIPAEMRRVLGVTPSSRVSLVLDRKTKAIYIKRVNDILDLAGTIASKKPFNPVKIREHFEKHYERK